MTPDWPERKYRILYVSSSTPEDEGNKFFHERYVLELERRYALLHQAVLERSQAPARGINCIELLAQCPPLPRGEGT